MVIIMILTLTHKIINDKFTGIKTISLRRGIISHRKDVKKCLNKWWWLQPDENLYNHFNLKNYLCIWVYQFI